MKNRYTLQQNGIPKRKNRTLVEMACCMIRYKNLPLFLWAEVVNTASHVLNRSPTSVLQNIIPEEAWSGRKPNVKYFRVFGCEAYAHVVTPRSGTQKK